MAFHSRYKEALSLSGRVDREPNATRLHQVIQRVDARQGLDACEAGGYALIGFSCDEGVRRNHGRVGAAEGPDALRRCLAGLPYAGQRPVYDLGSVICAGEDLEGAQAALGELVAAARAARLLPIVLGGGHETAWGHYLGLRPGSDSIGMLNFDAHFDLRELGEEGGTSGTPFLQIANDCHERHRPFQYCCIGIQHMGNTQALFQRAEVLKTEVILADEIILQGSPALYPRIDRFLDRCEQVYISICLDVFAGQVAPGVSAPQPFGLSPWHVLPLLDHVLASGKTCALDVVELCPRLDEDNRTARLGAALIGRSLACWRSAR